MNQNALPLHFPRAHLSTGWNFICDATNSPLRWLHFGRLWLPHADDSWSQETGTREETLVLLAGQGRVQLNNGSTYTLGPRDDPFGSPPTMLYIPAGSAYQVTALQAGFDAVITSAPVLERGQPLLFPPSEIVETTHGAGRWKRKIYMGTVGDYPIQRLMVGETLNQPGGWTSFPPHKHDERNPPQEMPYEEIYFFLIKPDTGFAIQHIYDAPEREQAINTTIVVHDGDAVVIPHGYHPVVGAPGHQMYYVWILCGEMGERTYGQASTDPNYAWLV